MPSLSPSCVTVPGNIRSKGPGSLWYLSNQSLLVIVVVGIVAGWLAGKVVEGGGFGLIWDLVVGLIGAFIGDWLLPRLGIHLGTGIVALVINAFVGAVVLLLILRLVSTTRTSGVLKCRKVRRRGEACVREECETPTARGGSMAAGCCRFNVAAHVGGTGRARALICRLLFRPTQQVAGTPNRHSCHARLYGLQR
jgi:uncharacterized membrane protein YeaQ/YmgE (transglycosylase-associated protein family)